MNRAAASTDPTKRLHRIERLIYPLRTTGCIFTLLILQAVWSGQPWTLPGQLLEKLALWLGRRPAVQSVARGPA